MPSDAVVEGVSGAIGGIVATVATYPLMTVNTLQATRAKAAAPAADVEGQQQQQVAQRPRRRGTFYEMAEVVREGGWGSLFQGLEASLIGTTVSQGIYFYLYSLLRRLAVLRRAAAEATAAGVPMAGRRLLAAADVRAANVTVAESLMVAALAGMGNVLLTNPIWMVATRMQAASRAKKPAAQAQVAGKAGEVLEVDVAVPKPSILAVARQVYAEYGIPGFWNGVSASMIMVINPTIQYALYEWLQAARAKLRVGAGGPSGRPAPRASAAEVFLISALAKTGATLLTYPMMNIKTRLYVARRSADGTVAPPTTVLRAAAEIMRTEGPGGYYRGLRTKIVQSVLAAALLFVAKEKISELTRDVLVGKQPRRVKVAV